MYCQRTRVFLAAVLCCGFVLCAASRSSGAQQQVTDAATDTATDGQAGRLTFSGSSSRLSVGYDSEFDVYGEYHQAIGAGPDADSVWLGNAWISSSGAGGLQIDYHWLGGQNDDDYDDRIIQKLFFAADQNDEDDRKITAGWGLENEGFFAGLYASKSVSGIRRVGRRSESRDDVITFEQNGTTFRQARTVTTFTDVFERPYDYGVGARAGRWFAGPLLQIQGGVDYEWGDHDSDQLTLSATGEKFFYHSPHSLALHAELYRKSGDFDDDDDDARVRLLYRYDFDQTFKPAPVAVTAPAAERLVANEVALESGAFFDFDRSEIRADARVALDDLAAKLRDADVVGDIDVVGHTCDIGTDRYNQGLSERRARAVRDFLAAQGLRRISAAGRGESQPAVANDSEANRRKNRRVEIRVKTRNEVAALDAPITVKSRPAWVERALHNPAEHKRAVDTYRIERGRTETALGDPQSLNQPPDAVDDSATVGFASAGVSIDVLANDSDPDNDALTVSAVAQSANGTVVNNSVGVTYTPNPGFLGVDVFTYTAADGRGGEDAATVTVTVSGGGDNRPPTAADDRAVTNRNTPVTVDVLANDSDPDNDALTVSAVSDPAHGSVVNNGGDVTYTPGAGFRGADTFVYTASDGRGGEDTATVTVRVPRY